MIDFSVKRQFVNCFEIKNFHLIVIMFEQTFFQFVDNSKSFLIFNEEFFVIFCDDCNNVVNHDNAKILIV